MVLRGEMESPVNTVREEVMGIRSLFVRLSFWKALRYKMLVELSMFIHYNPFDPVVSPPEVGRYDDVDLLLDRAFRVRGGLAQLSNVAIKMSSADEVFDLIFEVMTLLGVMTIVAMEVTIPCSIALLPLGLHQTEDGLSRLYHIRADPHRVVEKAHHIKASEVPCALRESVKTKKRVSDSGRLGVGVLESGVIRSVVLGAPERNFEGCCGLSASDCHGAGGPSSGARKSDCHHPYWGLYLMDEPEEGFNKDDRDREKGLSSSPGSLLAGGISSPRRSPSLSMSARRRENARLGLVEVILWSYYHEAQGIRSDVVSGTLGGRYGVGWSVTSQDLRWRHTVGTVSGSRVAALSRDLGRWVWRRVVGAVSGSQAAPDSRHRSRILGDGYGIKWSASSRDLM
ncbi:hypothetical protein BHE74_00018964 [Ensete ventricosum]|nr:hypothetical protein BHE74_00018964 [Ensete ventricosum]